MKIPNKKVKGQALYNGQNSGIHDSLLVKIVVFPLKWQVLEIWRTYKAENWRKLRK